MHLSDRPFCYPPSEGLGEVVCPYNWMLSLQRRDYSPFSPLSLPFTPFIPQ